MTRTSSTGIVIVAQAQTLSANGIDLDQQQSCSQCRRAGAQGSSDPLAQLGHHGERRFEVRLPGIREARERRAVNDAVVAHPAHGQHVRRDDGVVRPVTTGAVTPAAALRSGSSLSERVGGERGQEARLL